MRSPHSFVVPGTPRGKGRPKFFRRGSHVGTYTDEKTASYENLVRLACGAIPGGPFTGAVHLSIVASFPYPKSWPKKRVQTTHWHTSKPDLDNVVKACKDGLNGVAWADDSCVARVSARKVYSDLQPHLSVLIEEIE